ncbi:MAG: hypothetical protein A2W91_15025 [Bacteroidetes bacterium GWF2_38_335]|nr:MAG: hypothetical protein A2W91_15025 [Bacteroidetes bacterium GWF2_38_335]OFY78510.1 MAG: hypothetical protein A2281_16335 [Bacteroidetes bacterium RIFOXYA12_FULL_38_20]HBS88459.1 hypothetical protein [Bacteroidales bacterium]
MVFCHGINAQENRIEFKANTLGEKIAVENPGFRAVSFNLFGVINETKRTEIENLFKNEELFKRVQITIDGKCFMLLNESITADLLRAQYLMPNMVDYDFVSVVIKDQSLISKGQIIPEDFPKFVDTGNPESDNATFKTAKDKWIQENPERYDMMHNTQKNEEEKLREQIIKLEKTKTN